MTRSDEDRLDDILEACVEVLALVARGREVFDTDRAVALAIERLLEIVGEAAGSLGESTRARYPDVAWRDLARLRIVLAHHYHRIDPDQVWTIAASEIPALQAALQPSPGL